MFAGVATPSMAQKPKPKGQVPQKLTFEFEGETIEVAKWDLRKQMNWYGALRACEVLGDGWRLPSIEELEAMYEQLHMEGKGSFKAAEAFWSSLYWSSSVNTETNAWGTSDAYIMNFNDGDVSYSMKDTSILRVRAVRTLP